MQSKPKEESKGGHPLHNPWGPPLEISSDEEEDQDKTFPTSPPDHERGYPTVHEYQPKSLVYPPPSDSSDDKDFSNMPDLVTPEEGDVPCHRLP